METNILKRYKFRNAEIGIMSEIMLPKKIQYQGFVFETLLEGLTGFSFESYYGKNKEHIDDVLETLTSITALTREELRELDRRHADIFKGYSMFEVDGVFRFSDGGTGMPKPRFVEERTQMLRVFFLPEYDRMLGEVNGMGSVPVDMHAVVNFCDLFFNLTRTTAFDAKSIDTRLEPYITNPVRLHEIGLHNGQQAVILRESLKRWVNAVIFFVFGFIIHEICLRLEIMFGKGLIGHLEEEIWVQSQWGVLINKTVLTEG